MNDTVLTEPQDTDESRLAVLEELRDKINEEIAAREAALDPYPFVDTHEKGLRCYVLEKLADADIDDLMLIRKMDLVAKWIQTGELPKAERKGKHLQEVPKE